MPGGGGASPAVAVITPTKNRLRFLREALDSVEAQSLLDWEHIVVDDGSNDGTDEEMGGRCARDPRVRYIKRKGLVAGANVCRNQGIGVARAHLIVFLDSDDLLRAECLDHRVEVMRRNLDLDWAVFRGYGFEDNPARPARIYNENLPGDDLLRFLSHECIWEITSPIWRREFLERIGGFDNSLLSMQDMEMHIRAIAAGARYICFPTVDHDIRWQNDVTKTSVLHFRNQRYFERAEAVCKSLTDTLTQSGLLTWSRRRALTGLCFNTAELWARDGALLKALSVWNRGCVEPNASLLRLSGFLMLLVCRFGSTANSLTARLVNKWKGWVRFRQEPRLLKSYVKERSV